MCLTRRRCNGRVGARAAIFVIVSGCSLIRGPQDMKPSIALFVLAAVVTACSSNRPPPEAERDAAAVASASVAPTSPAAPGADAPAAARTVALGDGAKRGANPELIRQGYHAVRRNGHLLYCKEQAETGSRFTTNLCLTEEQLLDQTRRAREDMERMRQGACVPPECNGR